MSSPVISGPSAALARLTRNHTLLAGVMIALFVLLPSFFGRLIYTRDPYYLHLGQQLQPPSWAFPLGTDSLGRDVLALLFDGGKATLIVALPAAAIAFVIGVLYGLAAAIGPAWVDRVLMRLLDTFLALPSLVVMIFFAALVTLNNITLVMLIGFVAWPGLARLVRNEAIAQRGRDFVAAAEQLGAGRWYVARVHLLRVMAPILAVNGTFLIGDSIFALSALSFLGLGVQPPQASWGSLLDSALDIIALDPWWMIMAPGVMIFASLLASSLIGQGLNQKTGDRP
jgi:peptide/nickel transport system permease protein